MQSLFRYSDGSEYAGRKRPREKIESNEIVSFSKGAWNENDLRHGYGELTFADHAKYCGQFENGFFSGLGCIIYPDSSKSGDVLCEKANDWNLFVDLVDMMENSVKDFIMV